MRFLNPTGIDRIKSKNPQKKKPLTKRVLHMPIFNPRILSGESISQDQVNQLSFGLALACNAAQGM